MPAATLRQPSPTIASTGEQQGSLLMLDGEACAGNFSRRPFLVEHRLCEHPLFQLPRLLELSRSLPESNIEYNAGDLPVSVDTGLTPRNGLSVDETIRRIEECRSWMVLKYVEQDAEYRALLNACLEEIRPYSEPIVPGMSHAQAFVFLTSPGSVTPYHIDPEHNFLLQIRGSKTMHVLDGTNPAIVSEQQLEGFYSDSGRNLKFDKQHAENAWRFELQPGLGVHVPVTYPHWVKNGPEVSVSFSVTFRTPGLDRRQALYRVNNRLRRMHLRPAAVGSRPLRDSLKYQCYRAWRRVFGGHEAQSY